MESPTVSLKSPQLPVNLGFVDDRKQFKIYVSPDAKKIVEDFAKKMDMTEQGVASRMYTWFGKQPEPIQLLVLGIITAKEGEGIQAFAAHLLATTAHLKIGEGGKNQVKKPKPQKEDQAKHRPPKDE